MPDSPKPVVSALIVSHNAKDLLLQCMQALFASADVPVEAVVVDNDSSDGSAAAVTAEYPKATVLIQAKNLGFGRAALDRVGFFDPRYFMYGEDIDLCYRLKLGGWKVFYLPTATASHQELER